MKPGPPAPAPRGSGALLAAVYEKRALDIFSACVPEQMEILATGAGSHGASSLLIIIHNQGKLASIFGLPMAVPHSPFTLLFLPVRLAAGGGCCPGSCGLQREAHTLGQLRSMPQFPHPR